MRYYLYLSLLFMFFVVPLSWAESPVACDSNDPDAIVAEVFGRKITHREVQTALNVDLYNLQKNIFSLKRNKIDEIIGKIVLEKEAARRKMTVQELTDKEVKRRMKKVSKGAIHKFYTENKSRLGGTKEQLSGRIKSFLEQENFNEAYGIYLKRLKKKARAKVFLGQPERPRIELSLTPAPTKGKENAKVEIVEFSDFECTFCQELAKTLDKVFRKYKRHVKLTFKAFPLAQHSNAILAHQASLCAHDQNKFWAYHDLLFKNIQKLQRTDLETYANKAKLNIATFKQCLDSGEKFVKVQKELLEGQQAGVRSTPTLFINGKILVGNVPQKAIEELINEELKRK